MSHPEETPVLVGVGQVLQRLEDPRQAAEPLELMVQALQLAGEDARAPGLLARADSLYALRGMWPYGDPGREIARRIGAGPCETVSTPYGGNFSQACVIDAARRIQAGSCRVALVVGAENGRSAGQAQRLGIELRASEAPGSPDRMVAPDQPIFHEAELARGMNSASDVFSVIGSAIRHARGESIPDQTSRLARLWAGMSQVAETNPHAWIRRRHGAEEIGTPSAANPMVSHPYTRFMNANARVDMGAALVVCSLAVARAAGVPRERLVFLHAAVEAQDSPFLSTRRDFHRSPALALAGPRLVELVGCSLEAIQHLDLYSCFPAAVELTVAELGIAEDRPLTVTGGLTFGGGPLNSYGLHATARMVEVLRSHPGELGMIHGMGGWIAKHNLVVYGSEPPPRGFRHQRPQEQGGGAVPLREALVDFQGSVHVEAYTVSHRGGEPRLAHVACLTEGGARTWATLSDADVLQAMMREEFCGRRGELDGRGLLRIAS